ncbi:MAG: hypothetical protein LBK58_12160 [Prevotellaceae bacterium]|jgi:hypothetical protein|nr:hypothetical protein [Prevotellaceae bacterium]
MDKKFTEQESLAVIGEMIDRARNNVQKGSANSLIYYGYAVALVAMLNYILLQALDDKNMSFAVWYLMIPLAIAGHFLKRKLDRSAIVKTHIDGIIACIWKGFSVSIIALIIILFSMAYFDPYTTEHSWIYLSLITPMVMIMTAMAEFGMAKACRYRPFYWGAIFFWTGALLCLLSYVVLKKGDVQFIILAVCMIAGFVIPGYSLNKKAKQNV